MFSRLNSRLQDHMTTTLPLFQFRLRIRKKKLVIYLRGQGIKRLKSTRSICTCFNHSITQSISITLPIYTTNGPLIFITPILLNHFANSLNLQHPLHYFLQQFVHFFLIKCCFDPTFLQKVWIFITISGCCFFCCLHHFVNKKKYHDHLR